MALKILSENNEDITVDQTIFLLSTIVNNQLNQSPEPVSINFIKVCKIKYNELGFMILL